MDQVRTLAQRLRASGLGAAKRPITRFAPSPTGHLHLGHVANAVWTWGLARALGGEVILRMEDHDRGRCRAEFEASILDDLAWLGLAADRPGLARQSDHPQRYARCLELLAGRAEVYGCACSRKLIAARMSAPPGEDESPYDNHCRALGLALEPDRGVRVALPREAVEFEDFLLGSLRQRPSQQCGDLLLRERNGYWTYQFCVVADDIADGIDLVVRGVDILPSTGRQLLLARMLGHDVAPTYVHHPLINAPDGRKLSKREAAQGIRELRAAGRSAESVLGEAAFLTGLSNANAPISAVDLARLFE